ncbi:MAG: cysteine--tRNA ligase [Rhodobacteraceae bacterium]|nr:cysteine--tRNA ligase [Paracoccaceae bacterium]
MTEIRLYNTKTRKKQVFKPLDAQNVRMYVCGPTVYDRAHIGNARPVIVFDVLFRLLRHVYGEKHVTYARNFTDVDDKINARAAESGRSIREITDETIGWYLEDMAALGNLEPDKAPRATEYIDQMVTMIAELIASGHAYAAEGHVLFDVTSYEKYGSLSGRSIDDMIAGARVEVAPYKRNPMDFVLWKPSADDLPGWDSPWGRGRPGWHIECSAMTRALFGERFDIHGGGLDLAFPHHENEKAQSCCEAGEDSFAQVWMHNEMLQVEGRKMSKSLGNFFSVRELLDQGYPGEVIRFVFLSTHYRKPMDWTEKKADAAEAKLRKWHSIINATVELNNVSAERVSRTVLDALGDDLNTHLAIARIEKEFNDETDRHDAAHQLANNLSFLGLLSLDMLSATHAVWIDKSSQLTEPQQVAMGALLDRRNKAKQMRNWVEADRIRDDLLAAGIRLIDKSEGTDWELTQDFDPTKLEALK